MTSQKNLGLNAFFKMIPVMGVCITCVIDAFAHWAASKEHP